MSERYRRVRRRVLLLPLRVRLALAGTLLLPVALAVVFGLVFIRFESNLNSAIDADLRARAEALATMVAARGPGAIDSRSGRDLLRPQGAFAQVVDARGRVVATSDIVDQVRLLTPARAATAVTRGLHEDHGRIESVAKRSRLVAVPVRPSAQAVVVGRSLKGREGANESFGRALLVGGPLALLLSGSACYLVAAAALRPVETMRRRAAEISGDQPSARLPVPPADDEIGRLGHTLNDMLGRLEEALSRQRELTQNASHELRTPLTVLTAEIELTLQTDLPEDARAAMTSALDEARRVSRLADDLLTLSQLEESGLPLSREPVDLDELLRTVAARARERAGAEGRSIAVSARPTIVHADPIRLEQAVGNLVDNALTHGEGTVTLALRQDGPELQITVSDEGRGVPPGLRTLAFERFSRSSGTRGGAGLGLAIVRAVAQAHGGRADIALDAGSAIVLTLPAAPDR
jgi:two-component system, OmpR family, sensor kinase